MKQINAITWAGVGAIFGTMVIAGSIGLPHMLSTPALADQPAPTAKEHAKGLEHATSLSNAFKAVAKQVTPSVVHITAVDKPDPQPRAQRRQRTPQPNPFDNDMFRRFFGEELPEGFQFQGPGAPQQRERMGQGTGVIVREDGYILTNNHVAAEADELTVRLDDDKEYSATVVGTDPETDLAVLKIEATGLPAATLGDSDAVEAGDWVVAIGSPFGLQHTVTAGIVSATGRNNMGLATYENFIQTDAAINPGNSGGPLVSLNGEVIGINTAISTRTGGYMGIGFAIPSNMVKIVMDSLIDTGGMKRGWLGVNIRPLSEDLAASLGYDGTDGALISATIEGTPANEAGLQAEDIITKINGKPVSNPTALMNIVGQIQPGETATIAVFRDGSTREFEVTLSERPDRERLAKIRDDGRFDESNAAPAGNELGLTVESLTADIARQIGVSPRTEGVVVSEVEPGSSAEEATLRRGDVITTVNGQPVTNVEDFERILASESADKGYRMQIRRQVGGQSLPDIVIVKPETK